MLAPHLCYRPLGLHASYDLDYAQSSQQIQQALRAGTPFLASRLGSTETISCLTDLWEQQAGPVALRLTATYRKNVRASVLRNSGVFPIDSSALASFHKAYLEAMNSIDLLGSWLDQEQYLRDTGYLPSMSTTYLEDIVPFIGDNPWSQALAGMQVLVVHPFKRSIESQYARRTFLFEDPRVLPEFELIAYPAVQSIGGSTQYASWAAALDRMKHDIAKLEFDAAIIGCGAYGLPLGAFVKSLGKPAIHLGGVTQCLFGIKGHRWAEDYRWDKIYFNEHWVWPRDDERPSGADAVENACYWGPAKRD